MRTQPLLLAIPSVAMAVVGFAMFGPGAVQPFDGARIRGGPLDRLTELSWRITVLQRFRSIDSTRNIGPLVIHARDGAAHEAVGTCSTRGDGTCDIAISFPAPVIRPVHAIVISEATGAMLAQGEITGETSRWGFVGGHPALLEGSESGDLSLEVQARRGAFAAPFRDELTVTVRDGQAPIPAARVTMHSDAADLDGGSQRKSEPAASPDGTTEITGSEVRVTVVTSENGEATFGVTPRVHVVDVDIDVTALGRTAAWHGVLPVLPGAMWLDPDPLAANKIRVVSAVPRDVAYATIAGPDARFWGGVIPLQADTRGYWTGEIDWQGPLRPKPAHGPLSMPKQNLWLTLASDALASGAGTVGWPVRDQGIRDERPFRDLLLLDGMPVAEARDEHRRYRARSLSAVALGAAAVLEGVLLAQSAHARGLRAWAWTALAVGTVALAFAAIGIVVMWKTGG